MLSAQLLAMELLREGCHMPCDSSSSMSSTSAICATGSGHQHGAETAAGLRYPYDEMA